MKIETMRGALEALLSGDQVKDEDGYIFKFEYDSFYGRADTESEWEACGVSLIALPVTIYTPPVKRKIYVNLAIYQDAHYGTYTAHQSHVDVCNSFGKRIAVKMVELEFEEGEGL